MVNIISKLMKPLCKLSMHHLERSAVTVRVQCVDVEALVPPGKRKNKFVAGEFVWHLVHYLLVHIFQRREIMLTHTKDSVPVQARGGGVLLKIRYMAGIRSLFRSPYLTSLKMLWRVATAWTAAVRTTVRTPRTCIQRASHF